MMSDPSTAPVLLVTFMMLKKILVLVCVDVFIKYYGYSPDFSDIDECQLEIDNCHMNATCMNTYGSFSCSCDVNFFGDGIICFSKFSLYIDLCYAKFYL